MRATHQESTRPAMLSPTHRIGARTAKGNRSEARTAMQPSEKQNEQHHPEGRVPHHGGIARPVTSMDQPAQQSRENDRPDRQPNQDLAPMAARTSRPPRGCT